MPDISTPCALVVTSIHSPGAAMNALAAGCQTEGWRFIVAGDRKSPAGFALEGCDYFSLDDQRQTGFKLADIAPEGSYTRKNIGYLVAVSGGARTIIETDDDNHPKASFWHSRARSVRARSVHAGGWVNAYRYFSDAFIYPRGLPLESARDEVPVAGAVFENDCPIQQGLADRDPDVDAVYRMLFPLPLDFRSDVTPVCLEPGAWCPFNSQNTTFFDEALPLLYLPSSCSFRMTDIWRSFVAQRILHACEKGVLFHSPTVWQERNEHILSRDFADEIPGYLHNARIREVLEEISLSQCGSIRLMMERCYQAMISNGWLAAFEETLLTAWLDDLDRLL